MTHWVSLFHPVVLEKFSVVVWKRHSNYNLRILWISPHLSLITNFSLFPFITCPSVFPTSTYLNLLQLMASLGFLDLVLTHSVDPNAHAGPTARGAEGLNKDLNLTGQCREASRAVQHDNIFILQYLKKKITSFTVFDCIIFSMQQCPYTDFLLIKIITAFDWLYIYA